MWLSSSETTRACRKLLRNRYAVRGVNRQRPLRPLMRTVPVPSRPRKTVGDEVMSGVTTPEGR